MRLAKILVVAVCMIAFVSVCSGCGWMGKTAGKAKAGTENAIENTKEGYHQGYEEKKKK